jgi:hypothetical protein
MRWFVVISCSSSIGKPFRRCLEGSGAFLVLVHSWVLYGSLHLRMHANGGISTELTPPKGQRLEVSDHIGFMYQILTHRRSIIPEEKEQQAAEISCTISFVHTNDHQVLSYID